jgi:hypothetical protein
MCDNAKDTLLLLSGMMSNKCVRSDKVRSFLAELPADLLAKTMSYLHCTPPLLVLEMYSYHKYHDDISISTRVCGGGSYEVTISRDNHYQYDGMQAIVDPPVMCDSIEMLAQAILDGCCGSVIDDGDKYAYTECTWMIDNEPVEDILWMENGDFLCEDVTMERMMYMLTAIIQTVWKSPH